jgi:hypothetical protein
MSSKTKKPAKVFMGAFVDKSLKDDLQKISKEEKRSLNAQVEIFLALGVQHLKQKQAA